MAKVQKRFMVIWNVNCLKSELQNKDLVNCGRAENEDSTEKDTRVENNFNGESTKKINSDLER